MWQQDYLNRLAVGKTAISVTKVLVNVYSAIQVVLEAYKTLSGVKTANSLLDQSALQLCV